MMELHMGDAFDVMRNMADDSVDVVFTSPPYNRKRNDKYEFYDDNLKDYNTFLGDIAREGMRIAKRYVIINVQKNYYNKVDVFKFIGDFAKDIQEVVIWEKSNPMPASGHSITNAYEFFFILGDESVKSNHTYTKNHITTSVNSNMPEIHKAVMKQDVSDWFIEKFTKPNDLIMDPFMGLGTTGLSCTTYGRRFIGVELNETYYNFAKESLR